MNKLIDIFDDQFSYDSFDNENNEYESYNLGGHVMECPTFWDPEDNCDCTV